MTTYRSDVYHRRQLQDIFDRRLGGIQCWGLQQGDSFGHGGCVLGGKEGDEESRGDGNAREENEAIRESGLSAGTGLPLWVIAEAFVEPSFDRITCDVLHNSDICRVKNGISLLALLLELLELYISSSIINTDRGKPEPRSRGAAPSPVQIPLMAHKIQPTNRLTVYLLVPATSDRAHEATWPRELLECLDHVDVTCLARALPSGPRHVNRDMQIK